MITTSAPLPSASIRGSDWAWAQSLIADMQADTALLHLLEQWQQAERAFTHAELSQQTNPPNHRASLEQLIAIGHGLQQLVGPEHQGALGAGLRGLQFFWDEHYKVYPPLTDAAALAESDRLQALCFPAEHAA